ncbi:unnamed protein product, partial [marine sediment metagenome]
HKCRARPIAKDFKIEVNETFFLKYCLSISMKIKNPKTVTTKK